MKLYKIGYVDQYGEYTGDDTYTTDVEEAKKAFMLGCIIVVADISEWRNAFTIVEE